MTMKTIAAIAMSLIVSALSLRAAGPDNYAALYTGDAAGLERPRAVTIPDRRVSITDFGGKGDGVTLNSDAFARAIAALDSLGGGHLDVPRGVWLTGPITLRSNIDLHLERNALVIFSPDRSLYVDHRPGARRVLPCITASRCHDIAITGEGTLDGNGALWRPVKRGKVSDVEWKRYKAMGGVERDEGRLWYPWQLRNGHGDVAETPERQEKMRNDLLRVYNCDGILLQGVTLQNAPKFHVHPFNSRNIVIDGVTVRCPWNAQNGDAIDLSDCHRALIVDTTVDAGDDGLCMKSGDYKPDALVNGCSDILITDCTVYHAHGGFVIGSEDITAMKRIVVRDCTFSGTDTGLRFKSGVGRGGVTADIRISGIMMNDIAHDAITFQCDYADRPAGSTESDIVRPDKLEKVPVFTDIRISDVVCRGTATAIRATGISGLDTVRDITIENSTFVYTERATAIDTATARITLTNVSLIPENAGEGNIAPR